MKGVVLIALLLLSKGVYSGAEQTGMITRLLVHHNASATADMGQTVIIRLEAELSNGLCSDKRYWAMYLKNDVEKAQYGMLLASYMTGKKVKILGNPDQHCINSNERVRNVELTD